jgi:thioredoxin-related protein
MKTIGVRVGTFLLGLSLWGSGLAQALAVQRATDLSADGAMARDSGLVILLMVSQDHCGWCDLLKREQLLPMIKSGQYRERVLIRELLIDPGEQVQDFAGRPLAGARFASRHGVYVTPTLLFLGPDGRELSPRIVGINTPEFFGWYLDRAIEDAQQALAKASAPEPPLPTISESGDAIFNH